MSEATGPRVFETKWYCCNILRGNVISHHGNSDCNCSLLTIWVPKNNVISTTRHQKNVCGGGGASGGCDLMGATLLNAFRWVTLSKAKWRRWTIRDTGEAFGISPRGPGRWWFIVWTLNDQRWRAVCLSPKHHEANPTCGEGGR